MDLAGRVALVTGASSGIGRATAMVLARRGARVVVHGRDPQRTADVASVVCGTPLLGDLSEPRAAEDLASRADRVHGRIDILVASAGVGLSAPFTSVDPVEIDRLVAVDLVSPIRLARAVLPGMVERRTGHLVLISSIAGRTGVAGEAVYAATKAGLDAFAESVRLELAGTGVSVTTVVPGLVMTPFFATRGRPPVRRVPGPLRAGQVAEAIATAIVDERAEVWMPRWLRVAPMVRAVAPGAFRRLAARFGEPVRTDDRHRPQP